MPQNCKGRGLAKKCEAEGGPRIDFADHILGLWKKIGYTPPNADIAMEELGSEVGEIVDSFSPAKATHIDEEKFAGVTIRQFPKDTDQGEVMELLCNSGLPEVKKENAVFNTNGVVSITDLDNSTSKVLIKAIHGKVNFGKKLYCNGIIPLTPEKPNTVAEVEDSSANSTQEHSESSAAQGQDQASDSPSSSASPARAPPSKSPSFIAARETFEPFDLKIPSIFPSNEYVARGHSLSVIDRTPPGGSIAAEILQPGTLRPEFLRTKSVLNELKDLTERLSDFGSCVSSSSDDSEQENIENGGFKTVNEKKRIKKNKRKLKITPGKEDFLKKPNLTKN
jgi:hypothetical protein